MKQIIVAFGRFQPPTKGHERMIDLVHRLAKERNADICVLFSTSGDDETNPISPTQKHTLLKRAFPNTVFKATDSIYHSVQELLEDYGHLVIVAGQDRAEKYRKTFNDPNIEFAFITRTPAAISGSQMRKWARTKKADWHNNHFQKFLRGTPTYMPRKDVETAWAIIRNSEGK